MISYDLFMTTKRRDTLVNLEPKTLYDRITGGLAYAPLQKTMFKDVASANNSKLTVHLLDPPIYPRKAQHQHDPLQTVPWT